LPGFLLDTDVISETARPRPTPAVLGWISDLSEIWVSSVSIYELSRGIHRLPAGHRRRFLDAWFDALTGSVRTVPFDERAALAAAELEAMARGQRRTVETRDLFILASAKANGLHVATRNVAHFAGHGVVVYDPFEV
jgi:predicted nucleic acid-binding protein